MERSALQVFIACSILPGRGGTFSGGNSPFLLAPTKSRMQSSLVRFNSANAPRLPTKPAPRTLWPFAFIGIFGLSFYSYTVVLNRRAKDSNPQLRKKASPSPTGN